MRWFPFTFLLFAALSARAAEPPVFSPEQLTLSAEARGVLAHNCTKCHGQQKQKGKLRLDVKADALKGGENGIAISPGVPDESELLRRIRLPHGDDDLMPPEKGLEPKDIEMLRRWIAAGAPWPEGATAGIVFQRAPLPPRTPDFPPGTESIKNPIDKFVSAYFAGRQLPFPEPVDDRTFLRRASLDTIGLVPTWEEVSAFQGDRAAAVAQLLARDSDYAIHWLTFWNDALRNDYSGAGYIDGGRAQISKWLYNALLHDLPYDEFVRQLVAAEPGADGFVKGIKWRGSVSAGQRVELQAAQSVAQVFLGLNLKCASCHDSFISDYKLTDSHAFAAIFADKPLSVFRCDKATGETTGAAFLWPELGALPAAAPKAERQRALADLLTKPEDGRLARTMVNRLWAACFGRGLVEPVDVMDNAPWSRDLLDWLAADFASHGYHVKQTLQLILTSRAYQLPAAAVASSDDLVKQTFEFHGPVVRRMSAEQFSDAVGRVAAPLYVKRDFAAGDTYADPAARAQWIWHDTEKKKLNVYPVEERFFRASLEVPKGKKIRYAILAGTADNEFTAYVNGRRITTGANWEIPKSADLTRLLQRSATVTLAIQAKNTQPGAAGLRCGLALYLNDEKEPLVLASGPAWKSSDTASDGWEKPEFDDGGWQPAIAVEVEPLWKRLQNFSLTEEPALVRAALVKIDAFQNILGRPVRDQVNMSRPTAVTLLQAMTFANGRTFTTAVEKAATVWSTKVPDPQKRLAAIYHAALLREPRPEEAIFAQADPRDLLWSVLLQPEFQLIR